MAARFDLTDNPFAVLGASPRANSSTLSDAKADRIFDSEYSEAALEAAHADLIIERRRLFHELSWLSDIAPNRARALVAQLEGLSSADACALHLQGAQLSSTNLAADFLCRFPNDLSFVRRLVGLHQNLDWVSVRQGIQEAREVSGFGSIKDNNWKSAQAELVERHASALILVITGAPGGLEFFSTLISESFKVSASERNELLNKAVSQYDRWSIPRLDEISEKIDTHIKILKLGNDPAAQLSELERSLTEWARISQPVQVRDQVSGLDEPRSLSLFERVRDVAIWFANERANPQVALCISETLASAFSELPTVVATTTEDFKTLSENIAAANTERALLPLHTAANRAMENLHVTAQQILAGELQSGSGRGVVAALAGAFHASRRGAQELPDPNLPWFIVRSLALALSNDINAHDAAKRLVELIIETAPLRAKERLQEDLSVLRALVLKAAFAQALERSDLRSARDIIPAMIDASPDERADLVAARNTLDDRIRSRNFQRAGWGIAAAILLIVIVNENSSRPESSPAPFRSV